MGNDRWSHLYRHSGCRRLDEGDHWGLTFISPKVYHTDMPYFSKISTDRLSTCDLRLQLLFQEVLKGYDHSILVGHRSEKEQEKAFAEKKSQLHWPESKHNRTPSRAVDAAPFPWNPDDCKRFYHFAGYVKGVADKMGIRIRWGGDWDGDNDFSDNNFNDLVHFELIGD